MEEAKGTEAALKLCRDILAPLVQADGGTMHVVQLTGDEVHIHLSGTCAGCPGVALTRDRVLVPVLSSALPKARVTVTTGWRVPDGAKLVGAGADAETEKK